MVAFHDIQSDINCHIEDHRAVQLNGFCQWIRDILSVAQSEQEVLQMQENGVTKDSSDKSIK